MDDAKQGELGERLGPIFMPHATERKKRVQDGQLKFVHYTNADGALRIFREKRVMMRNTVCMNDYREFEHGLDHLIRFFNDPATRKTFFDAVNQCGEGLAEEAVGLFGKWLPHNRFNVYVTCISEHSNDEDSYGRLSMWRAYGRGSVGVAIVLKSEPFWQTSDILKAYGSPVAYLRNEDFNKELLRIVENINDNCDYLKTVPRQNIVDSIFFTLMFAAACTKHPGFLEEREWRLVYLPKLQESKVLERSIETINGVPQTVYRVPLKDFPDEGLTGIELPSLLHKVIIGPSNFPWPLYEAFVSVLKEAGVQGAEEKVVISDIPLRSS
jgi:hypothetical protein